MDLGKYPERVDKMVIPTRVFTDEPETLKFLRGVAEFGVTEELDAGTTSRTSRIEPPVSAWRGVDGLKLDHVFERRRSEQPR